MKETYAINTAKAEVDPFEQFKQSTMRFQSACKSLVNAQAERADAEKQLQDIAQKVAGILQSSLQDPTVPAPGNSQIIGSTGQRGYL